MASANSKNEQSEIDRLYEISSILDNAALEGTSTFDEKYEKLYVEVLQASKGGNNAKKLAAQMISKYLKYFQKFTDKAINTLMDLCEEEDVPTRVNAIRALPIIAKDTPEHLPKLADILGQLLQAELQLELDNVKHALVSLLRIDVKGTLDVLFNQIVSGDEVLREKAVSFIYEKVIPISDELINPHEDVQKLVAQHIKKVLSDVSPQEFQVFVDMLYRMPIYKAQGAHELLEILADQAEGNGEFKPDVESVSRLTICLRQIFPLYQRGASSTKLMKYIATKVFPSFSKMGEQQQLQLLKLMAELSPHLPTNDAKAILPSLYDLMTEHILQPQGQTEEPKINFSIIECLLYMFHQLASKAPGMLRGLCGIAIMTGQPADMATELATDRRRDLDARLKHLEEKTKNYIAQLREALSLCSTQLANSSSDNDKKTLQLKKENLSVALRTTLNVQNLVQHLLKPQPQFISQNSQPLSWKSSEKVDAKMQVNTSTQRQQHTPAAKMNINTPTPNPVNGKRAPREVYVPPARQQQQTQQKKRQMLHPAGTGAPKRLKGRGTRNFY